MLDFIFILYTKPIFFFFGNNISRGLTPCFVDSWIGAAKAEGKPVPEPSYYKDEDEYSGKLTIRIPKRLHKELTDIAQEEGISLNQLILYALSKEAGRKEVSASTFS